jgi:CBS domain-containing protein
VNDLRDTLVREPAQRGQHLYPVVDDERRVKGVITRKQLRELTESTVSTISLSDVLREPVVAHSDEPLRIVVSRMAETGFTRLPVIEGDEGNLLLARVRNLSEERHRERVLRLRLPFQKKTRVGQVSE